MKTLDLICADRTTTKYFKQNTQKKNCIHSQKFYTTMNKQNNYVCLQQRPDNNILDEN